MSLLDAGPVGETYTILVSGAQTAGQYCLIDMGTSARQDEFFLTMGIPVISRTSPPPVPSKAEQEEKGALMTDLVVKYRTEIIAP